MSFSAEEPITDANQPLKKRSPSWSDLWLKNTKPLKHVIFAMQLQSLSSPTPNKESKTKTQTLPKFSKIDRTLLLSDELLLKILSKLTDSHRNHNFLVCKRWLNLQGRLVRSLKVLDWEFIESGRLIARFPNLTNVDLINGCIVTPHNSSIWLNHRFLSMNINFEISGFVPNWRICLLSVAEECLTLQELELHKCNDNVLRGIAACDNLQILKLVGNVDGLYRSLVSDIGLTILAQGCKRMDDGWLAALSYCENLKTLRFLSCMKIDPNPGPDEYLVSCPALEKLHLQKCQFRDKKSVRALFKVCEAVREIVVKDCWGLDNDMFSSASICRRVKLLSLEGCSLLTTQGLESILLTSNELQHLRAGMDPTEIILLSSSFAWRSKLMDKSLGKFRSFRPSAAPSVHISSQSDLEANLFKLMERRGYGEEYINRYKMMTRFHHQRVPLVILVCGTACVGKSTIATQLAQRLNLPNVLQTDMVYELLRTSTDAPLASTPVWARDFSSSEELITEFCRECRIVRKGLAGDLKKAMKDGKPIIIEGIHLDPSIYLMDEENKSPANVPEKTKEANPVSVIDNDPAKQVENNPASVSVSHTDNSNSISGNVSLEEGISDDQVNNVQIHRNLFPQQAVFLIIEALLEEWIVTRTFSDKCPVQDKDRLITNLKIIQDYLCSFKSQGLTVANISATTFPQTLDWLHGYLLQCIEQGISSVSSEIGRQPAEN
ncbi:hypothetical protein GH714_040355 [Hevea brasiliensis]|uniref:F-box domain-containing protein n=1 Tax=Hevea brasiliensis TaxID=3981 RepID=A0A6A6MTB3_HEVBR|nr:hypothetical protein GH714_040355 [Hevea brasiliensis]